VDTNSPPAPSEREQAYAVLDEAPLCYIGFIESGEPVVFPALHGRVGDLLYLHGSPARTLLRAAGSGRPLCISAVVLDGVAVGRRACTIALNYRSVLLSGRGRPVDDPAEKELGLRAITERITPGAWERGRPPSPAEVEATGMVALTITALSLRTRCRPAQDDEADRALPCWAGVIPLRLQAGAPAPEPGLPPGLAVPPVLGSPPAPGAGAPGGAGRTAVVPRSAGQHGLLGE
jgi:nitroimidazol reductase NimA-like FMN-containing flavoprotein (pyridoxamine 5'-phosphate oxidase superfamily)